MIVTRKVIPQSNFIMLSWAIFLFFITILTALGASSNQVFVWNKVAIKVKILINKTIGLCRKVHN